jgi:polyisoprenoid-binding protein YceI
MKNILIITSFLYSTVSLASSCYKFQPKQNKISWKAYKTPEKVGVGGQFNKFNITPAKSQGTIKQIVESSKFQINTSSVFTKNPERDKKIVANFFNSVKLSGQVKNVSSNRIELDLTMNGKTIPAVMKYTVKNNILKAEGVIDVLDFMMNKNLAAINKVCYDLHSGKTWSDVNIYLESTFVPCN